MPFFYFYSCRLIFALLLIGALVGSDAVLPSMSEARSNGRHISKKQVSKHPKHKKKARVKRRGVQAKAVYCVDLNRNKTLLARNSNSRLPVASLTKLMTAMVVIEGMDLGKKVKIPGFVRKVPKSVVGLRPGDVLTVRDLLHGMLIGSGNDCAETLAWAYPGGRSRFMAKMNRKARAMGMKRTVFYTPSGLDKKIARKTKNHKTTVRIKSNLSTAREIAHMTKVALDNKVIRSICLKKSYRLHSQKRKHGYAVRNTNRLLRESLPLDGGKTGYTSRAGHCLATKFSPGAKDFVIVVLGSPNHFKDTRLVYRTAVRKAAPPARRKIRLRRAADYRPYRYFDPSIGG